MGRPRREFSEEELEQFKKLAPSLTLQQLADFFEMDEETLRQIRYRDKNVSQIYKQARAGIAGKVAGNLIQKATDGDTASQIFYLKTQCGWKETSATEITGANGGPLQTESRIVIDFKEGEGETEQGSE